MNEINQLTSSEAGARAEQSTNQLTNEINKFNFMELMVVAQQLKWAVRPAPNPRNKAKPAGASNQLFHQSSIDEEIDLLWLVVAVAAPFTSQIKSKTFNLFRE